MGLALIALLGALFLTATAAYAALLWRMAGAAKDFAGFLATAELEGSIVAGEPSGEDIESPSEA